MVPRAYQEKLAGYAPALQDCLSSCRGFDIRDRVLDHSGNQARTQLFWREGGERGECTLSLSGPHVGSP